ncbi:DUF1330 domain-containing protein [Pseudohalioglobus lutimaris]|uniref:DUF1330 domain-containing protein n=1 Tax=Pseudohalioglobus lutimaris TaxID=1737061 RepID=A0A2N5WYQ9_9GAMM|nr:DUF1330 domain-containing protein [Pseudohalioglobus lutimaris]PLW67385.1 DUF1330 domain-containing protein [Pseudohalioglobus lutimaris]
MTAYAIIDVDIFDIADYLQYQKALRPLLEAVGAHYLVRGGQIEVLEGPVTPQCLLLIAFPSMDTLTDFYASDAYRALEKQRKNCSRAVMIAVRGIEDTPLLQD